MNAMKTDNKKNASIISIKQANRKMTRTIKIMNIISYILSTICVLMMECKTMEIYSYIENDSHYLYIVIMAMTLTALCALFIYTIFIIPLIQEIESRILKNNYKIYKIKEQEELELIEIYGYAKFYAIQQEITDLHK